MCTGMPGSHGRAYHDADRVSPFEFASWFVVSQSSDGGGICCEAIETALSCVYAGPRALTVCRLLAQAETDADALELASRALNRLAATDRRNVLASYLRLSSLV